MDWFFKLDASLMSQYLLRSRNLGFTEPPLGFFGCMLNSRHKEGMELLALGIGASLMSPPIPNSRTWGFS